MSYQVYIRGVLFATFAYHAHAARVATSMGGIVIMAMGY